MESRALLARAHRLEPDAHTRRGMGLAAFEAQHYALAIGDLDAALRESRRALDPAERAELEQLLTQANEAIARVHLTGQTSDLTVTFDGEPPCFDANGKAMLDAGTHALTVRYADGVEGTTSLTVLRGDWAYLDVASLGAQARVSSTTPIETHTPSAPPVAVPTPLAAHPPVRQRAPALAPLSRALAASGWDESTKKPETTSGGDIAITLASVAFGGAAVAAALGI
jgi:hypothetical protein